jgi:NAD(P)-dependent dehydrogenase (short-subunit alcohol dehydrogenase family)
MKLHGEIALITGASRGIGRAIAHAFAKEGADVAITGRDAAELETLAAELGASGVRCSWIVGDLAERGAVTAIYEQARRALGDVTILVNNAGVGSSADPKPVVNFDDDFWERTLYVNLTVPYLFCKQVLPAMLERKYGRILTIPSIAGKVGSLHGAAYSASKHGVLGLTRSLALEVVRDGITVNAICPGPVHTRINDIRLEYDAQRLGISFQEIVATITPMGRRLEPHEIAPLAVYLASRDASVITGQAYNIDAGTMMS